MAFALQRIIPFAALASAQSWRLGNSIDDQPPFGMSPSDFRKAAERPNATNSIAVWDLLPGDDKKKDHPVHDGVALDDLDWMLRISVISDVPLDGTTAQEDGSTSHIGDVTHLTIMSLTGPHDNPADWASSNEHTDPDQHHAADDATDSGSPDTPPEDTRANDDTAWQEDTNDDQQQTFDDGQWDEEEHNTNRIWDDATWNPKPDQVIPHQARNKRSNNRSPNPIPIRRRHPSQDACVIVLPGLGNDATRTSQDDNGSCEALSKTCREDLQKSINEQPGTCESPSLPKSCSAYFVDDPSVWASSVSMTPASGSRFFAHGTRPSPTDSDQARAAYEEAVTHVWPVLIRWSSSSSSASVDTDVAEAHQQQKENRNDTTVLRCIRASDIKRESVKPSDVPDRVDKEGGERSGGGSSDDDGSGKNSGDGDDDTQSGLGSGRDGADGELSLALKLGGAGVTGFVGVAACVLAGLIAF